MSVKPMAGFDMENRDPNNLNEHLQVKNAKKGFKLKIYVIFFYIEAPKNITVINLTLCNSGDVG